MVRSGERHALSPRKGAKGRFGVYATPFEDSGRATLDSLRKSVPRKFDAVVHIEPSTATAAATSSSDIFLSLFAEAIPCLTAR